MNCWKNLCHKILLLAFEMFALSWRFKATTGDLCLQVAYFICAITALYLMSGTGAGLVCNMIGCIYPIAVALIVIRQKDSKVALSWLPFWVEYGSLLIVDSYADLILEVFPIYWLVKAIILLYLLMPQTKGARKIHKKISVPAFLVIREAIANKTQ
uniref:Receptor expression-enhancing protein n=1 Tax=Parascaris univalens TaxID=6257 RepID=A0A915C3H5_PARUN